MDELVARFFAIKRRCEARNFRFLVAGSLWLNRVERIICRGGREIQLLPREFKLLEFFMQNIGDVVTRRTLLRNEEGAPRKAFDRCSCRA